MRIVPALIFIALVVVAVLIAEYAKGPLFSTLGLSGSSSA